MSKPIVVHEAARLEYLEATAWYEARRQGLGTDLVEALDVKRGVRVVRVNVRRFPSR